MPRWYSNYRSRHLHSRLIVGNSLYHLHFWWCHTQWGGMDLHCLQHNMEQDTMKKLALSLIALLALCGIAQAQVGPPNPILCNKTAFASPSTATTTSMVTGVAGQTIQICGWHVTSIVATQNTFQFEWGTQGGPCTTPTTFTPAFGVINSAPSVDHIEFASVSLPAGAQLCVVTTAATALQVLVWYSQF